LVPSRIPRSRFDAWAPLRGLQQQMLEALKNLPGWLAPVAGPARRLLDLGRSPGWRPREQSQEPAGKRPTLARRACQWPKDPAARAWRVVGRLA
jgi:hypothetical protein